MKIPVSDCVLHAEVHGAGGVPVVLIHGLGGCAASWEGIAERLAAERRTIVPDLRGCGASERGSLPYSLELLGDDVVAILEHAGVERCHLVGHSLGGVVAQDVLTRYGGRIVSAVLVSTSSKVGEKASAAWRRLADAVEAGGLEATAEAQSRGFGERFASTHPEVVARHADMTRRADPKVYAEQARAASSYDYTEALEDVRQPVLIVQGLADRLTSPGGSVIMSRALPRAELWMVDDVGHNAHIEMGSAFVERLLGFFTAAEVEQGAAPA